MPESKKPAPKTTAVKKPAAKKATKKAPPKKAATAKKAAATKANNKKQAASSTVTKDEVVFLQRNITLITQCLSVTKTQAVEDRLIKSLCIQLHALDEITKQNFPHEVIEAVQVTGSTVLLTTLPDGTHIDPPYVVGNDVQQGSFTSGDPLPLPQGAAVPIVGT